MRIVAAIGLMVAAGWCAGCGKAPEETYRETREIRVNGIAEVAASPDRLSVHLGVETLDKDPARAQAQNDERVAALLAVVRKLGVAAEDVQTGNVSLQRKESETKDGPPVFEGYEAMTDVAVLLRDMGKYNSLVREAIAAGVNRVSDLEYGYGDVKDKKREARLLAVRAAKEKAVELAGALGKKIGDPVEIDEEEQLPSSGRGGSGASLFASDEPEISTIAAGRMVFGSEVHVRFELKD